MSAHWPGLASSSRGWGERVEPVGPGLQTLEPDLVIDYEDIEARSE